MEFHSIYECKFGSNNDTCEVFVCETDNGTYWYCCEGGSNWNESTTEPVDGCDLTSPDHINDIDCFELDCNGFDHFVEVMTKHLEVETVDRAVLTIEIASINSAFQDGFAQQELVNILKNCIDKIERQSFDHCKLKDSNGNDVGDFYLNIESEEV